MNKKQEQILKKFKKINPKISYEDQKENSLVIWITEDQIVYSIHTNGLIIRSVGFSIAGLDIEEALRLYKIDFKFPNYK